MFRLRLLIDMQIRQTTKTSQLPLDLKFVSSKFSGQPYCCTRGFGFATISSEGLCRILFGFYLFVTKLVLCCYLQLLHNAFGFVLPPPLSHRRAISLEASRATPRSKKKRRNTLVHLKFMNNANVIIMSVQRICDNCTVYCVLLPQRRTLQELHLFSP